MAANLERVVPMLLSADVARSLLFYTNVLGFQQVDHQEHGGKEDWIFLRRGKAEVILSDSGEAPDPIDIVQRDHKAAYYFFPEDLRALRDEIAARGAQPSPTRMTPEGMNEFELVDPDGHVLVFGESVREHAPA